MKKNKVWLLGLFIIVFLFSIKNIAAESYKLSYDESGYYYSRIDDLDNKYKGTLKRFSINNRTAYCIEPEVAPGTYYDEAIQWEKSNLSVEVQRDIVLYANFGFEYEDHSTLLYRAATQALIWERILGNNTVVTYYSDSLRTKEVDISSERKTILALVKEFKTLPSFSDKTFKVAAGESLTLTDYNSVLTNYKIIQNDSNIARASGNSLIIKPPKMGSYQIKLERKALYQRDFLIFYDATHQDLVTAGDGFLPVVTINIEATGGKVVLDKVDYDTSTNEAQGQASLEGAVYGLYKEGSNDLITTLTTDKDGHAETSFDIDIGNYYIQEITPSKGYELDTTKYPITMSKAKITNLTVKEKVKKRDLTFIKILANKKTGVQMPEANITFGIYDLTGKLIVQKTTDADGKIELTLPYGKYVLKQLTVTEGYEMLDDYYFEVTESGSETKVFADEVINAYLKIIKIDSSNGKIVPLAHIKFKIYDLINKKYITQSITYPTDMTIDVFETNANGYLLLPQILEAGKYRIEEVDEPILGYTWNKNNLEFTIDKDSDFVNDKTYGKILEIKFKNDPVKGTIEIYKKGKTLQWSDNEISEKIENLENVMFGLYADEDIYDKTGTKIYSQDDLIGYYYTDKLGYIKISDLPLGKYYLKEIKTLDDYLLNNEKIKVELKYKDQYTKEVYEKVYVENIQKMGKVKILKIDGVNKNPLAGVSFEIYDMFDNLISTLITDEFGTAEIILPLGKYYILEKETIDGYVLSPEKTYLEIKNANELLECTIENNPIIEVPDTYMNIPYNLFPSLGLIGYVIFKKKFI